jgi:nitroimidazol reductase NimA-like FMN-containing flavoprotein (pyridoxamine 5'-phosphate oxidase superfamily)
MAGTGDAASTSATGMVALDRESCYVRLRSRDIGRMAVKLDDDLVILPVYYALLDDDIVFRTSPGTKLSAALLETKVAFEIDGGAPGWSVLVRGRAEELRSPELRARARACLGYDWPAGDHEQLVRIRAEQVTGRLVPRRG